MSIIRKMIPRFIKQKIRDSVIQNNSFVLDDVIARMAERKIDGENYSNEQSRFNDNLVVINGATGSIGSLISKRFAQEGANVIVCGRNANKVDALVNEIKSMGFKAGGSVFNLNTESAIKIAFEKIIEEYGKIDVLINCAGGSARDMIKPLTEQSVEVIDEIINLNLRAPLLCCKYAGKQMIKQNSGSIINFSSLMGTNGKEGYVEYGAAKSGIIGLTKGLAIELGKYNINVNSVVPSYIPIHEITESRFKDLLSSNYMNTVSFSDDIYNCIAFLVSKQARFITGQNIIVDGGRSLGLKGD